jgi:hypothetical protein
MLNMGVMARRTEMTKHPALALKTQQSGVASVLEGLQGWDTLLSTHRLFLAMYCQEHDVLLASRRAGVDLEWFEREVSKNAVFSDAIEYVVQRPEPVTQAMLKDMLPMSVVHLQELIEQKDNQAVRLNAIKHLHQMGGLVSAGEPVGGNFLNVNVQMFGKSQADGVIDTDARGIGD